MTESGRGIGPDLVKYIYISSTGRLTYAVHIVSPRSERKVKKKRKARETSSRFYYNMCRISRA